MCNCFTWIFDMLNKFVTMALGCMIVLMVCLGFFVTLTAGVAYGYNYSIAEFMHIARNELERFAKTKPGNLTRQGGYMTLANSWNWLDYPGRSGGSGGGERLLPEGSEPYLSNMKRPPDLTAYEISKLLANQNENRNLDRYPSFKDDVRIPVRGKLPTEHPPEIFLKDLFPTKTSERESMYTDQRPTISAKQIAEEDEEDRRRLKAIMSQAMSQVPDRPTRIQEDVKDEKKNVKPFMFSNVKKTQAKVDEQAKPTRIQEEVKEVKKKIKPFMFSNIKKTQAELDEQAKSKGVLPDIPDYGEYGDEDVSKKPI